VEDAGERGQDLLNVVLQRDAHRLPLSLFVIQSENIIEGFPMLRSSVCLAALLLVAGLHVALAQTTAAPATGTKPSRVKLTIEKLKEMQAKWSANKPKLRACRKEVRRKGLAGDDRWFYIADCMER
jgi:hypothetical protein